MANGEPTSASSSDPKRSKSSSSSLGLEAGAGAVVVLAPAFRGQACPPHVVLSASEYDAIFLYQRRTLAEDSAGALPRALNKPTSPCDGWYLYI